MNVLSQLKILKEKFTHNTKFMLLTGILPIAGLIYFTHTIYKYKIYKFYLGQNIFSNFEEKQIGKKLYPILKYKNIENFYEKNSSENETISRLYEIYVKQLKLNVKPEIFLIKSDVIFFYVLPTGSAFLSDVIKFLIK